MSVKRMLLGAAALAFATGVAQAQSITDDKVKIAILTDMAGVYSDLGGQGAIRAAEMAIEDFGGSVNGKPIEIVSADHQNKADIASATARKWYDTEQVDAIFEMLNSSVALAVQEVTKEKNKVNIVTGAATTALTGANCSPNGIHYVYDTYALSVGTGRAMVAEGGDTWFFITADYAFGHSLENETAAQVKDAGGEVVGSVRAPFPTADFSSFLLQAQGSGAKVIGLANAGADTINAIKQAKEFGITEAGQDLAGLLIFITDVHSLGLETAQDLLLTTGFYWDRNEATREFSQRFAERMNGRKPTMVQAGIYSSVMHYLKAIQETGTDEAMPVVAKMKEMPINDFFATNGVIRKDGRMVHDMYLARVKKPEESTGEWDYFEIVRTIPGEEAYKPMSEECSLVSGG